MALSEVKLQIIADDRDAQSKIKALTQELKKSGAEGAKGAKGISQYSDATADVGKTSKTAEVTVRSMGTKVQEAGSGMALAGAAAVSLWNAYDNVSDSAQKVEIAEAGVARGELTLSRAREALTKLQQSGTASALDLEQAQLAVTSAEGRLERSNLQLTNSQEALNEAWLNAATTIVPSIFTGVTGLTSVYEAFTSTIDEQIASYAQSAAAAQDSGIAIQGLGKDVLEVTETTGGLADATTELGAGFTEVGASALEGGAGITELGADVTEFTGDAVEANAAVLEMGSAMTETGANVVEFNADVLEAGGALVELGADATEFSGDMLETAGNTAELAGALGETGKTALDLGNDVGTMGGALVEAEGALASTAATGLLMQERMKSVGKVMGGMVLTVTKLAAAFVALPIAGAIGQWFSYAKSIEAVADPLSNLNNLMEGFNKGLGDLFSFIPGAKAFFDQLSVSVTVVSQVYTEMVSRLPLVGGLFKEQGGLASILTDKLGFLGDRSEETQEEQDALAKTVQKVDSEFAKMSPLVQQAAQAWGLYGIESAKATQGQQAQIAHMQELDTNLKTAREGVIDLAVANGVDLQKALSMTDEQMRDFILNADDLGPTMEQQAEMTAAAAQKFADSWIAGLDAVTDAQNDWAGTMKGALSKMGEEFGEEIEVGISDIEKKVKKGLAFNDQFWEEIFPEDVIGAALVKGVNMEDTIEELKDTIGDVVDEGLITKDEAKRWFGPLQEFMKEDLPDDSEEAFGYLAGRMPHLIQKLKPAIINGMIEVGGAAKDAVNKWIVKPIELGLGALETGESGLKFGQNMLRNLEKNLGEIRKSSPQVAAAFQQVFDNIDLSADQKVQEIIGILGQINPAWRDQIMQMDSDADGIADIMDDKILGPVDQMRLGILLAFQDVAEAAGDMTWATKLGEKINEITGATEGVVDGVDNITGALPGFTEEAWNLLDPTTKVNQQLLAQQLAIDKANGAITPIIGQVEGFTTAEWNALSPVEKINAQLAAHQALLDAAAASAGGAIQPTKDLTTAVVGLTNAFNAPISQAPGASTFTGMRFPGAGSAPGFKPAPETAPTVPPPNTNLALQKMAEFYKTVSDNWDSFWGGLAQRDTQMPPPGTSLLSKGLNDLYKGLNYGWDLFWKSLGERDTQMPPPGTSLLSKGLNDLYKGLNDGWDAFWKSLAQRDTQMPPPGTSLLSKGLNDLYKGLNDGWDLFWKLLAEPDTQVPAPKTNVATQALNDWYTTIQTAWDDFWAGLKAPIDLSNVPWEKTSGQTTNQPFQQVSTTTPSPFKGDFTSGGGIKAGAGGGFGAGAGGGAAAAATALPPPPDFTAHKQAWTDYATHVRNVVGWIGASLFTLKQFVTTTATNMAILWVGHAAAVGIQVDAIGQHIIRLTTGYGLMLTGVQMAITQMAVGWSGHAEAVGLQVNATGNHLIRLITGYGGLMQGAHQALENMNQNWSAHAGHVSGQINVIGRKIIDLITAFGGMMQGASQATRAVITSFAAMASSSSSSASRLAGAISSSMGTIQRAMGNAQRAADNLRQAINRLQNKSITVTTTYKTVGVKPAAEGFNGNVNKPTLFLAGEAGPEHVRVTPKKRAAKGFSGVVTEPTRIFAGEGNRPELVQVTPLSSNGSGAVKMNQAAAGSIANLGVTAGMNRTFSQPTIRAGGSKSSSKRADSMVFMPNGDMYIYMANGDIRQKSFKDLDEYDDPKDWNAAARKKARGQKGLKDATSVMKAPKGMIPRADEKFMATGLARTVDPLLRSAAAGGTVGRGGKSLFDLGVASGPAVEGDIIRAARSHGLDSVRWVISEKRYADGSYSRYFSDGTVEYGRDIFKPNTRYLTGKLKEGKSVKEVKYFANGKAEVTYVGDDEDDKPHKMKHDHPGPFDQGNQKKKSERYTTKAARHGFQGLVTKPTRFTTGEEGAEFVSVKPFSEGGNGGAGVLGGGRPIIINREEHFHINGKEFLKLVRSEELKGIYAMT